jgi:peptidoglycan/LPS O-acetylase OafA/YrhL
MKRVDDCYVGLGLIWLLAGMVMGTWMGATNQLQFANSHAHLNLVGFVTSVAFGLIYRAYPTMRASRWAWPQLALYEVGAILLVAGKAMIDDGGSDTVVKIGAIVIILGVAGMAAIFATRRSEATDSLGGMLRPNAPR